LASLIEGGTKLKILSNRPTDFRPFNYMFFTPLYGVRNTGCPKIIAQKKCPQISNKKKKKKN
jgi:hypothetical protein